MTGAARASSLAGRPLPVLVAAVVLSGALVFGAMFVFPVLQAMIADLSPAWQEAIFSLLLYGLLAIFAVAGRRLAGVSITRARTSSAWVALGAVIGIGGLALALGDCALAGSVRWNTSTASWAMLSLGTMVTLGQSASEELFFRGWVQPVLKRGWGAAAAIGVTAVAFAALHVAGGARSPLTLVNLLLGGIVFGVLAVRSGGLAASIAAHAGWNWAEAILFGLDPNPGTGSFGALADFDLVGAAAWGGSGEGLNASVAMTIVLAALVPPLAIGLRRPFSPVRASA